jgi:hypothetical protein
MAFEKRSLDDYVDVAQRLQEFYDRYPDGSLGPLDPAHPYEQAIVCGTEKDGQVVTQTFIVYIAVARRTPDDAAPGVGAAWEVFPGRTPYTRGSELMNAETSAWGRALASLGIATKKGIASRQEVQAAQGRQDGLPTNADGSLSRSRTTDAEKDAAGVMTAEQQAEHTALQPKAREQRPVVRRSTEQERNEWETVPPPAAEEKPGTVTAQQRMAIFSGFSRIGVNDRDKRIAMISHAVGREVASSNDLSMVEAVLVLEALAKRTAVPAGEKP